MFLPIFMFGCLWGWMYSYLLSHAASRMIGVAFGTALLLNASQFEIASVKLLGGMVAKFLVLAVVLRYCMPGIYRWICRRPALSTAS